MKNIPTLVFILFTFLNVSAQDDDRSLLRGTVLYRSISVPNENVINITAENAVISDEKGQFAIMAKAGDELAFTAINYQMEVIKVTEEIIKKGRLVVEVTEKVTELDEVVVSPENQEKFIQLQNEEFKKVEYDIDRSTEVENIALSQADRGMKNGLNFVNIFKALAKSGKGDNAESRPRMKMSEVLRQVYDDEFFVADLKLPQAAIDDFLQYIDTHEPEYALLLKKNEFELIDFLVNKSKAYREQINEEK
ncbi:hypothetical protein [Zobellia galactanivorans]|uniref:hypothetical protein n=1 Tax=Zobellia galactanivorans (strain DSM 12802 / CCUG 47099 / CIP 106680 / NCIMB 13871 / Dsij) TaxID=63186 RepID=UPI001C06C934|nr:hypothetical protein [Zobellia galactanivorans]MBU3027367.1 hypothetical protein [Zobellia galactanivorans]